jgi:hypothetical protein
MYAILQALRLFCGLAQKFLSFVLKKRAVFLESKLMSFDSVFYRYTVCISNYILINGNTLFFITAFFTQ